MNQPTSDTPETSDVDEPGTTAGGQPRTFLPRRTHVYTAAAAILVTIAGVSIFDAVARGESEASSSSTALFATPHIMFRSLEPGADFSRIGYTGITADPDSRRTAEPRCARVAAAAAGAVCLRAGDNPTKPYEAVLLDDKLRDVKDDVLAGTPSRARLSDDGQRYASTVFVAGHGYISLGFSTETVIYRTEGKPVGNVEEFAFLLNGERANSLELNVWGVTFANDPNRFYATVASQGRTYLVEGDIAQRTLVALQDNAECPSLSPDGDTIVYKKRVNPSVDQAWRFYAFDLTTGEETPLGEERSIDDQVAWLDDDHILYAAPKTGDVPGAADIWTAPIDGGEASLLIPDADSPTVTGSRG